MATIEQLKSKAGKCGPAPNAPTAVLPQMVAARLSSQNAFERLQGTVDYLTCIAKASQSFNEDQKEFMHDLFEAFAIGGRALGMPEAATLASHYVNGRGARIVLQPAVYQNSVIVRDTSAAMAAFMAQKIGARSNIDLTSTDITFMRSPQARTVLRSSGRSEQTHGALLPEGALIAEQINTRLKNADHRFILRAMAVKRGTDSLFITWVVTSTYDFDPFSRADYWTDITLGEGRTLKVPDGLSEYIAQPRIGVAHAFEHEARWHTTWSLKPAK